MRWSLDLENIFKTVYWRLIERFSLLQGVSSRNSENTDF